MKIVKFTQRDGFTDIDIDSVMTWREGQSEDDALEASGFVLVDGISSDGGLLARSDDYIGRWKVYCNDAGRHWFTYENELEESTDILYCENVSDAFALKLKLRADMQARNLSVGARELTMFMQRFFRHWLSAHDRYNNGDHEFWESCRECETYGEMNHRLADEKKKAQDEKKKAHGT